MTRRRIALHLRCVWHALLLKAIRPETLLRQRHAERELRIAQRGEQRIRLACGDLPGIIRRHLRRVRLRGEIVWRESVWITRGYLSGVCRRWAALIDRASLYGILRWC